MIPALFMFCCFAVLYGTFFAIVGRGIYTLQGPENAREWGRNASQQILFIVLPALAVLYLIIKYIPAESFGP